jgi:ribosomal protein S18 acetylase RimI-like enzyme
MEIRKIKPEEFEAFYKFKVESVKYFKKITKEKIPLSKQRERKSFLKRIGKKEDFIYFIIQNKKIAGYIDFNIWKKSPIPTAYVNDIIITKEFQGKGLGKSATRYVIKFVKKKGVKRIGLGTRMENIRAQKLYEDLGFKKIGINYGMQLK